ncbi:MAG: SAM-dependent methyltransferase [Myxococcota bacterium]
MRAQQVSRTALKVSRILLFVADDPRRAPLLPPRSAETTEALLRATGLLKDWHLRAYRSPRFKALLSWSERTLAPGVTTHVALRKRVIEDETEAALEDGATQVLVVGAGFDTLALRLGRLHRLVRFVELDHPATQSLKRHALDDLDPPANLVLHPADLSETSLADVLDEVGWNRHARSVVIAEGLLMVLEQGDVADFLRGVASVVAPGSRLLGTYRLPEHEHPQPGRLGGLSRASLKAMSEPLRWSTTPEALAALLEEAGFRMHDEPGRIDLNLRYLVPAGLDIPLNRLERIMIAERGP